MPFLLLAIGIVLVLSAIRGTHRDLGALVRGDFTGENNFFIWILAIGLVGAVGYYSPARAMSRAFLGLILVVMILRNKEFFTKLSESFTSVDGGESAGSGKAGNTVGTQAPASSGGSSVAANEQRGLDVIAGMSASGMSNGSIAKTVNTVVSGAKALLNPVAAIKSFFGGLF